MEHMVQVAKKLRTEENFNGYIHLKAIPGASEELIGKAGLYADRLSVNIEIPTEINLKKLAPEKSYTGIINPMNQIRNSISVSKEERKKFKNAPLFAPAGQSTQLIIGATPETDRQIILLSSNLYHTQSLKRVYYSGYIPVNPYDNRLPALNTPPLVRENRLYQSDWLMRFYKFKADEILSEENPFLDPDVDPKLGYALRNLHLFPIDINRDDYEMILRIPGVGVQSAQRIIQARKHRKLTFYHLKKIGVVLKRAKYFIKTNELPADIKISLSQESIRRNLLSVNAAKRRNSLDTQLYLFDFPQPVPGDNIFRH
jgi:putative DNA modification/repair radical SAM protein